MMPSVFIEGCINIVVILYTYHCIVAWRPIGEKNKCREHTHTITLCSFTVLIIEGDCQLCMPMNSGAESLMQLSACCPSSTIGGR